MINEFLNKSILKTLVGIILLMSISLFAQLDGTDGEKWLEEMEEATREGLSMNVEEIQFANDSFFDVFVETVLREGLPEGVVDPELGTALTSEEVTRILRAQGPELVNALRPVQLPNFGLVQLAPGAAVKKWDKEARWSRGPHVLNLYTWARVNQWIRISMNKSKIAWSVYKPGRYSTDCMYLNIHSNGKIRMNLDNYGPLTGPAGTTVPTSYALSKYIQTPPDHVFVRKTMNGAEPVIDWVDDGQSGTADVGNHTLVKVWNHINVHENVGPGLYSTPDGPSAVITVIAAGI